MKKQILLLILAFSLVCSTLGYAKGDDKYYGPALCKLPDYNCIKVQGGQSWKKLFPNEQQRYIVQAVNRTDSYLWRGKTIAVPKNLDKITLLDVAPFPRKVDTDGEKLIVVDQDKLAWGAYNRKGKLLKWGPVSSGRNYCSDVHRPCKTITGVFQVFNKKGADCRSNVFPVGRGGSRMPYCMFFYRGYALHGSYEVPGYRDSHGCIRMFPRDAKWLNQNFVELSTKDDKLSGTKVIVMEVNSD